MGGNEERTGFFIKNSLSCIKLSKPSSGAIAETPSFLLVSPIPWESPAVPSSLGKETVFVSEEHQRKTAVEGRKSWGAGVSLGQPEAEGGSSWRLF